MQKANKARVVITGLGVVAPNGIGKKDFWQANIDGKSGVGPITAFDGTNSDVKIAGQVRNFDPLNYLPADVAKRTDRFVHFGVASARMALEDSRLNLDQEDRTRFGVVIGSGLGGVIFHEEQMALASVRGTDRINPLSVPRITPNAVASYIAIQFGLNGPNLVISTACASGTHAVGEAFRKVQHGEVDVCVSGGVEAPLTPITFGGYRALKVLSKRNDAPEQASRPFDKDRDGFVLAEAAAVLILEERERALKRNATIYAEVAGYAANSGGYHMVMPMPSGDDAARVMQRALADAGCPLPDVSYINAHGTSTAANDKAETLAVKKVFGDLAYKIPVSSTKSMIGHSIGAAGAVEAVVSALAVANDVIPPTINYTTKDPDCDLDYVPREARAVKVNNALSNSFGFGSCNACILLTKERG